jgi:hypothetical protein
LAVWRLSSLIFPYCFIQLNANAAAKLGWNAVHFKEAAEGETHHPIGRIESSPDALPSVTTIDDIQALREVWKELFL